LISPCHFRTDIVDILVERFRRSPESLADAFGVIWSIDSYATHVSAYLEVKETKFKRNIRDEGSWEFRLLWEASNATKHAIVRNELSRDVGRSDKVNTSKHIEGWAAYFSNAKHWGPQICINAAWEIEESTNIWRDAEGSIVAGRGPFFNVVPILDLIEPALDAIEKQLSSL
jgi:hypothetical protein